MWLRRRREFLEIGRPLLCRPATHLLCGWGAVPGGAGPQTRTPTCSLLIRECNLQTPVCIRTGIFQTVSGLKKDGRYTDTTNNIKGHISYYSAREEARWPARSLKMPFRPSSLEPRRMGLVPA